jgi:hypothetical protein
MAGIHVGRRGGRRLGTSHHIPKFKEFRMNTTQRTADADALIAQWRAGSEESPAGPLFAGGEYAEADIVGDIVNFTAQCGTGCSASRKQYCC